MRCWTPFLWRVARGWLPLAAGLTVLAATAYVGLQQTIRLSADDLPEQMAQDAAVALSGGATPEQAVSGPVVEISRSAAPMLLVFDSQGRLLASSATLHGNAPDYPAGVLETAGRRGNENRVTWQPEPGVRLATVAVPWSGGFVVGGASLKAAERRTGLLLALVGAGWVGSLGASLLCAALVTWVGWRWPGRAWLATTTPMVRGPQT